MELGSGAKMYRLEIHQYYPQVPSEAAKLKRGRLSCSRTAIIFCSLAGAM